MLWGLASILLLTGLALLTLALRGRRVGDAPHCRKCTFELTGIPVMPDAIALPPRCPECGRDLLHAGAVVYGRRAHRPVLLAIGAASLLLALVPAGLAISAASADLNPYKPAWLLKIEATRLKGDARDAAAAELLIRHKKSPLSPDRLAALVNPALDAQQSPATWENSPWWELLDAAFAAGAVGEQQRQRYVEQALTALRLDLPEYMLASEPWPARVTRFEPQAPGAKAIVPSQPIGWVVTLDRASLDGEPLPLERSGYERPSGWQWNGTAHAISVRPMGFGFSSYGHISSMVLPFANHTLALPPVDPHEHSLTLEYTVRAFAGSNLTLRRQLLLDLDAPTSTWPLRVHHTFIAKAEVGEIARFATAADAPDFDPTMEAHPKNNLDAIEILPSDPPRTRLMYSTARSDTRAGTPWIVGRIELRSSERVWPALDIWPLHNPEPITVTLPDGPHGAGLDLSVPDFPRLDKVDVVIVPDLHAAAVAGIDAPIWGEEIVVKDVPINWFQLPPQDDDKTGDNAGDE